MKPIFTFLLILFTTGFLSAQDVTPPDAKARPEIAIALGADGTATLTPDQVNDGSTDNVTSVSNLKLSLSRTTFTAADLTVTKEWKTLGAVDRIEEHHLSPVVEVSGDGTTYMMYQKNWDVNPTIYVKKWNGSSWEALGTDGLPGEMGWGGNIIVGPDGVPYIAFTALYPNSRGSNKGPVVYKWSGSQWLQIGGEQSFVDEWGNILGGIGMYFASAPDGTLYLSYLEYTRDPADYYRVNIFRWDGIVWEVVGERGVTPVSSFQTSLTVGPDGYPCFAYVNTKNSNAGTIVRWNGTEWLPMAAEGLFYSDRDPVINFAPDGTLYLAFKDLNQEGKVTVLKKTDNSWSAVGGAGFSTTSAIKLSMAFSPASIPVVAYNDGISEANAISKWNGTSWELIDELPESLRATSDFDLKIAGDGLVHYASASDYKNGYKTTVMRLTQSNHITLTVEDEAGNKAIAGTIVKVTDKLPPVVKAKDLTLQLGASGTVTLSPDQLNNGSTDNGTGLENLKFSLSKTNFSCSDIKVTEEWRVKGTSGFTSGNSYGISFVTAPDGTPYLAYTRGGDGKTVVQKWNGSSWEMVGGTAVSSGSTNYNSLAISPNGTPFVAFVDVDAGNQLTVMTWNGSSWEKVGTAGISGGEILYPDLAIAADGTPYVAYQENFNNYQTKVLKWNGTSWNALGTASVSIYGASYQSLAIAPDGTPYVAYTDGRVWAATVIKWNGSSWEAVGSKEISGGQTHSNHLTIASDGTPYITFSDYLNGNKASVLKYNGINWETVGGKVISAGQAWSPSLAIAPDGTPFVAYRDLANGEKASVLKWNGNSWEHYKKTGISAGIASTPQLSIANDGNVYVAYVDGTRSYGTTVQHFYQSRRVTLTVEDEQGLKSIAGAFVAIEDKLPPAINTRYIHLQLGANGKATLKTEDIDNGTSDNCGIKLMSLSKTEFSCADIGDQTVNLTVTDVNGNSSTSAVSLLVKDRTAPVVITKNITLQLDASGRAVLSPDQINNGSTDNCGIAGMSVDVADFNCSDMGNNIVNLKVTDNSGNSSVETAVVTIEDKELPKPVVKDVTLELDAAGIATVKAADINSGSSDNCSITEMTLDKTSFSCTDLGRNPVNFTVKDKQGNTSSIVAFVTVVDKIVPVLAAGQEFSLDENAQQGTVIGSISVQENCSFATWSITSGNTAEAFAIDETGTLTVNNPAGVNYEENAEFVLAVSVTDPAGNVSAENILIQVMDKNEAPVITSGAEWSGSEGITINFTATASDEDKGGESLQYSLGEGAPEDAVIDAGSGLFSWTPSEEQGSATYLFSLLVSDGTITAEQELKIVVSETNQAPVINSSPVTEAFFGEEYSYQLSASDADLPENTLEYKAINIPAWLSFDPDTRLLSGTPDESLGAGMHAVKLQVSDGTEVVFQEFSIRTEKPTGLFDKEEEVLNLIVYPNPTSGNITVDWKEQVTAGGEVNVSLFDLRGRQVFQSRGSLSQGTEAVSAYLQEAKAGIYLLQLKAGDSLKVIRLVKE